MSSAEAVGPPVRRWLLWVLGLQVLIALILFGSDVARVLPQMLAPSAAPALDQPWSPGDQTRRYAPGDVRLREALPGTRPLPSTVDMPSRLFFEVADWDGDPALTITGQIASGDAGRFSEWLERNALPELVFLNSPGGSVSDALAIGRRLRLGEATVQLTASDVCLSACPYILAGGAERVVDPEAWVGVHQHYFGENVALPAFMAVEDIQRGQGEVMAYLIEMGIDPAVMQPALLTPPDEIYLLTIEELETYGFIE